MDTFIPALIVIIAIFAVAWWIRRSVVQMFQKDSSSQSMMLLQNQIHASSDQTANQVEALQKNIRDEMRQMNEQVSRTLAESSRTVGARWDNAAVVIGDVRQRLGQMDEANKRIFEVGREIAELQNTLKAPKLRGSIGEYMLTELLSQVLPEHSFETQYKFKSGEIADAVIKLNMGIVAVDAKFPLDNFKRIMKAEDTDKKNAAGKLFIRDVKKHINDISEKYIRTDEGTFDFAMMYIPAENVYYEIMLKSEWSNDDPLFNYALQRHVIPVSPNSFYAYLQTILLGLRGMRVEESAREIMDHLARLQKELDIFNEEFRLVGQHLGNASKKFSDAEKRLGKVESKIEQMSGSSKSAPKSQEKVIASVDSPD